MLHGKSVAKFGRKIGPYLSYPFLFRTVIRTYKTIGIGRDLKNHALCCTQSLGLSLSWVGCGGLEFGHIVVKVWLIRLTFM